MLGLVLLCCGGLVSALPHYCQPGHSCWPDQAQVQDFASSLSQTDQDCIGLPTFSSAEVQGDPVTNYWYPEVLQQVTPFQLLNLRNKVADGIMAYFVVLARNESDVVKAVQFAASHNLGISVFSTGHEFNDRNAGAGNNSLLIRTTCLQTVQFDLQEENRFSNPDGFARLGAGLTWGQASLEKQAGAELCQALNSDFLCLCMCVSVLSLFEKNAAMGFRV